MQLKQIFTMHTTMISSLLIVLMLPFIVSCTVVNTSITLKQPQFQYFELLYSKGILSYDVVPFENNLISVFIVNAENLNVYKTGGNFVYYKDLSREKVYHALLHDVKFSTRDDTPPLYLIITNDNPITTVNISVYIDYVAITDNNTGAIVGSVVAILTLVGLITVGVFVYKRCCKSRIPYVKLPVVY